MNIQLIAISLVVLLADITSAQQAEKPATDVAKNDALPDSNVTDTIDRPKVEVVFVLDTTGSMSGLIEAAKQKIWAIANTLVEARTAPEIQFGLVSYRDRGDAYITQVTPLSDDIDEVYTVLMGFQAGGGGDGPESVNQALHESIHKIKWTPGDHVYRVIYLVGDAPPHMDYDDDITYRESCKMAAGRGIFVNTIQCGNMAETGTVWKEIAQMAEGQYAQIEQSGGAIVQESPFDKEIAEKSKLMDATRLYYGDAKAAQLQQAKLHKGMEIYGCASAVSVAQRAAFNCSSSGMSNFAGFQELVTDFSAGKIQLAKIEKQDLPEAVREMSAEEMEAHLKAKNTERTKLQKQIIELSKKRQKWLRDELSRQGEDQPELDGIIYDSIKTQAARRGIQYDAVEAKL